MQALPVFATIVSNWTSGRQASPIFATIVSNWTAGRLVNRCFIRITLRGTRTVYVVHVRVIEGGEPPPKIVVSLSRRWFVVVVVALLRVPHVVRAGMVTTAVP